MAHPSFATIGGSLTLAMLALLSACGPADSPDTVSLVPDGPVLAEDFCDLMDAVLDQGREDCCDGLVEAPAATCKSVKVLLEAESVSGGVVVYDPDAAGDYLRALEGMSDECTRGEPPATDFVRGTLELDADCSMPDARNLQSRACADGLTCTSAVDEEVQTWSCQVDEVPAALEQGATCDPEDGAECSAGLRCDEELLSCLATSDVGAACDTSGECTSGLCSDGTVDEDEQQTCSGDSCTCVDMEPLFCESKAPPSNGDIGSAYPDKMCVTADSKSGSGTASDINLAFYTPFSRSGYIRFCTITGGVATGKEECCDNPISQGLLDQTADFTEDGLVHMGVAFKSKYHDTDGLLVENFRFRVYNSNIPASERTWYKRGTFDQGLFNEVLCTGCSGWEHQNCGQCWIDDNGHGYENSMSVTWNNQDVHQENNTPWNDKWANQ